MLVLAANDVDEYAARLPSDALHRLEQKLVHTWVEEDVLGAGTEATALIYLYTMYYLSHQFFGKLLGSGVSGETKRFSGCCKEMGALFWISEGCGACNCTIHHTGVS